MSRWLRMYILIMGLVWVLPHLLAEWYGERNKLMASVFYPEDHSWAAWFPTYELVVGIGSGLWLYWYAFLSKSKRVTHDDRSIVGLMFFVAALVGIVDLLRNFLQGLGYWPPPHGK
jgi:hypothetical protein